MSANAIRQAPGWWASLVRAECDDCGWVGPVRDCMKVREDALVKLDRMRHRCGEDQSGVTPHGGDEW